MYFQAWFPRQHNYHPARPPRRLKMIDDLVDYRATMLVWAALGGGSISLPYLELEAWGAIDPRFRMHGFVNDSEFVAACQERGIKVFGTVFSCQGWEFPAELSEDGTEFVALNEERGVRPRGWAGLREFTQDALPGVWKPFAEYFPEGLVNSDGEPVSDLLEECCSRSIEGAPLHAHWLEVPDRDQLCHYMDRNNPVWLEYLKAIVRVQIDAGVAGVQFDETDTPIGALQYGGCFCKDCMKGFAAYLRGLPLERRPAELEGQDLQTFHYGKWLTAQELDISRSGPEAPLFWDYIDFQRLALRDTFADLTDYTRAYALAQGREVLITGNFYNVYPYYDALMSSVDIVVTEMRITGHRQPAWYRYAAGMADGKQVVVVENPYGGIVPELVEQLSRGRGHDRVRLSIYEGAAMGVDVTVPYGAWMGAIIEDAYYAPHQLAVDVQAFRAETEALSVPTTDHELAVLYPIASNLREVIARDTFGHLETACRPIPFWAIADLLAESGVPLDVVVLHDGLAREDDFSAADVERYRTLVAAGCHTLSARQLAGLAEYLERGGELAVHGAFAENLPIERRPVLTHPRTRHLATADVESLVGRPPQVVVPAELDLATTVRVVDDGSSAVHLVNYAYDWERDAVRVAHDCSLRVRLAARHARAVLHRPGHGPAELAVARDGDLHTVTLERLETYAIVHFQRAAERSG